jgi:hypothetical protein
VIGTEAIITTRGTLKKVSSITSIDKRREKKVSLTIYSQLQMFSPKKDICSVFKMDVDEMDPEAWKTVQKETPTLK